MRPHPRPLDRAARLAAAAILLGYERYRRAFRELTRRAQRRFTHRAWQGGRRDVSSRLVLYRRIAAETAEDLRRPMGELLQDPAAWRRTKTLFAERIFDRADEELAETWFNSITRLVFGTVGVAPEIEFVDLDPRRDRYGPGAPVHRTYSGAASLEEGLRAVLGDGRILAPFRDLEGDAALAVRAMVREWRAAGHASPIEAVEVVDAVFFRGTGAYLVGRVRGGEAWAPLVVVLLHGDEGVEVDAVLLSEREVSIVFSYTRAHFRVADPNPAGLIRFLRSILTKKPIAELYVSIGHAKHGKTELYRDLLGHLDRSMDRFEHAPGAAGMVMVVFTLHAYDYVFKVIRDTFAPPKQTTREEVRRRYQLVFEHDRAGRLIEAHEFEQLSFEAWRFTPELIQELRAEATRSVTVDLDRVTLHHVYVERKVAPLDLFVRAAADEDALPAVIDYGEAIRDLAASNIFPGDLLTKNFGLTGSGRVVFYDYDELCLVTECRFRDLPTARHGDEEMAAEAWYHVDEGDVFPEEFANFLGLRGPLRRAFLAAHTDVVTAAFWRDLQRRHQEGEVIEVFPYPPARRLRAGEGR